MSPISSATFEARRLERTQVDITDPADADEFLEDAYGAKLRLSRKPSPHREGSLLTHARATVGPLTLDEIYVAGQVEVRPDPLNRVLTVWPRAGRVSGACDGTRSEVSAGEIGMVTQPHLPHRAWSEDANATVLLLDPAVVSGVATGLPRGQAPLPIRFTSYSPTDENAAQMWKSTVRYIRDTVLSDDVLATPLVVGHVSRLLAAVTLAAFPNTGAAGPSPHDRTDHKPVLLRRAMEFMDANATNDIALADIAEAIHVTPRAVQYMFRHHLDTTPLQYLRRLRLHYAHQQLLAADRNSDTVTDIAARWGFAHTGRFAVLYRQTYGQSPHTTLRA
ncbi:AraC family transcriptional regulator [Mycobacterium sp. E740]|uniref:AraC family transcriptional regulator n=1 Tax=Mycobacterium sp. E740 TaxID=1834149 RepID=UPI0007FF3B23|nr:AraC family transcriptional regulator [Mycobacterium sp. E740]OBI80106.1 AraC family transcriptional regulator [Mycobacterium sp. E740]